MGKIPWRRKWQLTPVFLPRKFHGQRSLRGYSLWGQIELDTTEHISQTHITLENEKFSKMYQIKRIKTINITALQGQKSGVTGNVQTNVQNDSGHPSISGQLQGFWKLRGIFCFKHTVASNPKSVHLNREQQHFLLDKFIDELSKFVWKLEEWAAAAAELRKVIINLSLKNTFNNVKYCNICT